MAYYDSYPRYVTVAEKKQLAAKSIEKLRKKNPNINPVVIAGRKLALTWWGQSWNTNLESYSDYSNRIGRGRSYVRNGAVLDLQIMQGLITALVQGSESKPYQIQITVAPLSEPIWQAIVKDCAGKIDSLQELMEGKFPKGLSELFTSKGKGLFPAPKEIILSCSCPDGARMCKHVAAALYGVGARFDNAPDMFFSLRGVKVDELISETITNQTEKLLKKSTRKSSRVMDETDVSGLFGIDMDPQDLK